MALARRFNAAQIARRNTARWPAGTLSLHAILAPRFQADLPPEVNEALSNEFLVAFLGVHGAAWQKLTAEIDASLKAHDRALVLKMVDLYEQVKDDSLRSHLEQGLAARSGVVLTSTPPAGLAGAFRKALKAPVTRPEKFHAAATEALAAIKAAPDTLKPSFRRRSCSPTPRRLGCAFAQGEGGLAKFDELFDRPPNWGPAIPTPATTPGGIPGQQGGQVSPFPPGMAPMSGNDQAIDQALRDLRRPPTATCRPGPSSS